MLNLYKNQNWSNFQKRITPQNLNCPKRTCDMIFSVDRNYKRWIPPHRPTHCKSKSKTLRQTADPNGSVSIFDSVVRNSSKFPFPRKRQISTEFQQKTIQRDKFDRVLTKWDRKLQCFLPSNGKHSVHELFHTKAGELKSRSADFQALNSCN